MKKRRIVDQVNELSLQSVRLHLHASLSARNADCIRKLSRVEERRLNAFENTLFSQIGRFLATDAQRGPRHRLETPSANVLAAMHARSEGTLLNSEQR